MARCLLLDRDQLAVDAPDRPQPVGDLPHRGVGRDGLDDRRQQVGLAAGLVLEPAHGGLPGGRVPLGADPPEALDLAPLPLRVDPEQRAGGCPPRRRGTG